MPLLRCSVLPARTALAAATCVAFASASAACVDDTECRCVAPPGPHFFTLNDEAPAGGMLAVSDVGPGDHAYFTLLSGSAMLEGSYTLRGEEMLREATSDGWVSFTAVSDADILAAHRGGFAIFTPAREWYSIRRFAYHRNPDGSVELRLSAVDQSRIDWVASTILPGDDDLLTITARLTAPCTAIIAGVPQADPTFIHNPLCAGLLVPSP